MDNKSLGQHFIVGMADPTPSPEFLNFIRTYNIGGVLFLGKNYNSAETLVNTVNQLQVSSPIYPLFICVDHEGGRVQRFKAPFTTLPSYRVVSTTKSPKELFDIYMMIARELMVCGINLNLSPVADMTDKTGGVIGDRSVGSDVEKVETTLSATIRGFVKSGILCCVKHFPGHGCVEEDSHEVLPSSNKTMEELLNYEIQPFKRATKAGVHSIMMAHILFNNIDSLPSSLSPKFIQDIIRKDFRFIKLIITDDISMGAITKHYSPQEASKLALTAGNDLIIYSSSDINHLANLIDGLTKEVESDLDLKNQTMASQARIKEMKKLLPMKKASVQEALEVLNNSELKKIFT